MAQLYTKTKLYLEANSKTWDDDKVSLQNDGSGDYIKSWSYDISEPTAEQLDMQYWDKVNGTSTWQDAIAKVKSDNPKE